MGSWKVEYRVREETSVHVHDVIESANDIATADIANLIIRLGMQTSIRYTCLSLPDVMVGCVQCGLADHV